MTPEEKALLLSVSEKLDTFLDVYYRTNFVDKILFLKELVINNKITFNDAVNMAFGGTTGTKFGTSATQKIGFFGTTPVVQPTAITTPSGGGGATTDAIDLTSRTAIGQIKTALTNLGIVAP